MKKTNLFFTGVTFVTICFQLFSFNSYAQLTKLHDFAGTVNGKEPFGSLISVGSYLYGMTGSGGTGNSGIIFKIKPDGTGFTKLLDFTGTLNGGFPRSSLIYDGTSLYGTTAMGGANNSGTVFKIQTDGTGYTKLYDFTVPANGGQPSGSLVSVGSYLYGMTYEGGTNNLGVIYKIMTDGTGFSKIFEFTTITGTHPMCGPISDGTYLYGVTMNGGTGSLGTVFKILLNGTGFIKLMDFSGTANGSFSRSSLVLDGGYLYGTAGGGGTSNSGTFFKIQTTGTGFSKLLDFTGTANGSQPSSMLFPTGNFLYGMTYMGGANNIGTIYKIMADGSGYSKLLNFSGTANGSSPNGSLISDGISIFGVTSIGGANNFGTIFKYCLTPITLSQSPKICEGQTLTVGSSVYSATGTYHDTLTSIHGCDSIVTTNLTVNTVDASVSVSGSTITANASPATYKWVNCNNSYSLIVGQTNQSYTAAASGSFAVIVTQGTCTDTSACHTVIPNGIDENSFGAIATIHPNPFTSQTTITFTQEQKNTSVKIVNESGKEVKTLNFTGKQLTIEKGEMLPGTYFLQLNTGQKRVIQKLIIMQ